MRRWQGFGPARPRSLVLWQPPCAPEECPVCGDGAGTLAGVAQQQWRLLAETRGPRETRGRGFPLRTTDLEELLFILKEHLTHSTRVVSFLVFFF